MKYEKPKLFASNGNSGLTRGACNPSGSGDSGDCMDGNSALGSTCMIGPSNAGTCFPGSSAGTCFAGDGG